MLDLLGFVLVYNIYRLDGEVIVKSCRRVAEDFLVLRGVVAAGLIYRQFFCLHGIWPGQDGLFFGTREECALQGQLEKEES